VKRKKIEINLQCISFCTGDSGTSTAENQTHTTVAQGLQHCMAHSALRQENIWQRPSKTSWKCFFFIYTIINKHTVKNNKETAQKDGDFS